jgi:zinc protease
VSRTAIVVCVWCLGLGAAAAQVRNWPSEGPPRPLAARDIKFPPYELQTLPNGLQVVVVLHHEQPVVSMRLLVRAGSAADPKEKLGTARLTASLLDQGVRAVGNRPARSAQELADAIDFIGGAMGSGAGTDLTYLNMVVMKDSVESGMQMLSDMARYPSFTPAEIERQRQQMLSGLQVSAQDPEYVANAVFDRLVYGFHPYGMPDNGTARTLAALSRDDLIAFHNKYFAPNNAILAIVGDLTAEEAFTAARKIFGDWEKRELPADKYTDPPDPTRRVIVINKPDAVQTEVRVGHLGIPRSHPDYMAVNLAIRILGGEGSNRLHQVLRTERGLTYGAQANMDALKVTGDFEAETNTRSEATGEVLRLIVDEFWRLQRERVGERELADAKAYMTGSFPLTIETPDSIAMQVVNVLFYGLPLEQLQTFRERVNAVTVDDIQRVARAYLRPERLSVVLVGNAAAFTSQLDAAGFGTFETIDIGDLDLLTANFRKAAGTGRAVGAVAMANDERSRWARATTAPAPFGAARRAASAATAYRASNAVQAPAGSRPALGQTAEAREQAVALLDRVIAAKGGLEKLRAIRTIVVRQTLISQATNRETQIETTTYIQYPDRFRTETPGPGGVNVQVFDGTHVWAKNARGVQEIPSAVARDLGATLRRDPVMMLIGAKDGSLTTRLLPDVKDPSGAIHHALEIAAPDLNPVVLLINRDTAQIDRQTFVADAPGRPVIEEEFSDYRPVDDVQIAFHGVRRNGTQTLERRITDITINTPLDPALFKRPS